MAALKQFGSMGKTRLLLQTSAQITRLCFDYQLTILFSSGDTETSSLSISGPMLLAGTDFESMLGTDDMRSLAPLLDLFGKRVLMAEALDDGTLTLLIDGGYRLNVKPREDFEAWEFHGPRGEIVVCIPGGGLTEWPAKDDESATRH